MREDESEDGFWDEPQESINDDQTVVVNAYAHDKLEDLKTLFEETAVNLKSSDLFNPLVEKNAQEIENLDEEVTLASVETLNERPRRNRREPIRFMYGNFMLTLVSSQFIYSERNEVLHSAAVDMDTFKSSSTHRSTQNGVTKIALKLFAIALVVITISKTAAHEMVACDCSQPRLLGTIDLTRFSRCGLPPKKVQHDGMASYEVFQVDKQSKKFDGYACRQRTVGMKVQSFWTGSTDHQPYEYPVSLGAADCWRLVQTSK